MGCLRSPAECALSTTYSGALQKQAKQRGDEGNNTRTSTNYYDTISLSHHQLLRPPTPSPRLRVDDKRARRLPPTPPADAGRKQLEVCGVAKKMGIMSQGGG